VTGDSSGKKITFEDDEDETYFTGYSDSRDLQEHS